MVFTKHLLVPCDRFGGNPAARFGTTVGYVELYIGCDIPVPPLCLTISFVSPSVILPYPYRGAKAALSL
eukprot:scaffold270100_cov46-Attheya_sp.AAC.2